jgi:hypothetical protein
MGDMAEYHSDPTFDTGPDESTGHYNDDNVVPGSQLHPDDLASLRNRPAENYDHRWMPVPLPLTPGQARTLAAEEAKLGYHTGQLIGGPDDGNLITGIERIYCSQDTFLWLDGTDHPVSASRTTGEYRWTEDDGPPHWQWEMWSVHALPHTRSRP